MLFARYATALRLLSLAVFAFAPIYANAQVGETLNRNAAQPEVWRPATPSEPGVDAKGDLNLSVPVLTVPGRGGLDYDVKFSYTSGVRYDQRGSWIGTGWRFDPGSITRDVHGVVYNGEAQHVDYTDAPERQPDQYHITLPMGSSAMVQHTGPQPINAIRYHLSNFYLTDWRAWKVEAEESGGTTPVTVDGISTEVFTATSAPEPRADYTKFVITAEDGTRYVFAQPTISTHLGAAGDFGSFSNERYVNVWRLVAILGTDYTGPDVPSGTEAGSWIKLSYLDVATATDDRGGSLANPYVAQATYLSEILTPTHRAVFRTSYRDRENFGDWEYLIYRKLDAIELYSRTEPTTVVREVELDTEPAFEHNTLTSGGSLRLALKGLAFSGLNGTSEPGYRFTYYPKASGDSNEHSMDLFGYYDTQGGFVGGYDDDENDGISWSLKTIVYPAGGKDELFYENDKVEDNEIAYADRFSYVDGPSQGYEWYRFDANDDARQGGARVTAITRHDGMGASATTDYAYGPGHVTAIPPRYWKHDHDGKPFYTPAQRGQAAVYYEWVETTAPDEGSVKTFYTWARATGNDTHTGSHPSDIRPVHTLFWEGPGAITLIQGNDDRDWGLPYRIEYRDPNNRVVRKVDRELVFLNRTIAVAWDAGPRNVELSWELHQKLWQEDVIEYGQSGSSSARTTTEYGYFLTPGLADDPDAGNGLVNAVVTTHNDGRKRRVEYTYGSQKYQELADAHRLSDVVLEITSEEGSGGRTYHAASATTWKAFSIAQIDVPLRPAPRSGGLRVGTAQGFSELFEPYQTFAWDAAAPAATKPSFYSWTGGTPTGWTLTESVTSYNANGYPTKIKDARGFTTTLSYNSRGELTRVSKPTGSGVTLARSFAYAPSLGLLESLTDENGNATTFEYDDLGRLLRVRDRSGQLVTRYAYHLPRDSQGELSGANKVTTTRYTGASPSSYESIVFYDGLGRTVQTQEKGESGKHVVAGTEYFAGSSTAPRRERAWKPVAMTTNGNYAASYASVATSHYGSGSKPYTDTEFTRDGTGRTALVGFPYVGSSYQRPTVTTTYGVGIIDGDYYSYSKTTDEAGAETRRYADAWGNAFRSVRTPPDSAPSLLSRGASTVSLTTHTVFDVMGRPVEVRPPNYFDPPHGSAADWVTTYVYDTRGRLSERTTPDAGTVRFRYDDAGNLRYSQDAVQAAASRASFTTFDAFGRPLTTGIFPLGQNGAPGSFSSLNPNPASPPAFETNAANWVAVNVYDEKPGTTGTPWASFSSVIPNAQVGASGNHPKGRLVGTASLSDGIWQLELTSFDREERMDRRYVYTEASGSGIETAYNTVLDYAYNRQGQLTYREAHVGTGTARFRHWYDYGTRGLATRVYASTGTSKPGTPDVTYAYGPTGAVTLLQFGSRPATGYAYDVRDRLTNITTAGGSSWNPGALSSIPFIAEYGYRADGNVTQALFGHEQTSGSKTYDRFSFLYDGYDRLTAANYSTSTTGSSWSGTSAYDVTGIAYDPNGNLKALTRRDRNGAVVDDLVYTYVTGTNRLASIADGAGTTSASWDAESGAFGYDANGNAVGLPAPYRVLHTTYDHRNLPITVASAGDFGYQYIDSYRFAASGQRYLKEVAPRATGTLGKESAGLVRGGAQPTSRPTPERGALVERSTRPGGPSFGARFTRAADGGATAGTAEEPAARAASARVTYVALDGLERTGTQPTVGTLTGSSVRWSLLSPTGEVLGHQPTGRAQLRRYYHKDLLGSTRAVVDAAGDVKEARAYDAWGVLLTGRSSGATSSAAADAGYTGKERDAEVGGAYGGLDYFGARTYTPAFGRFLQVDPLAEKHPDVTPYHYVLNNPLALVDPDGRSPFGWYRLKRGGPLLYDADVNSQADLVRRGLSDAQYVGESFTAINGYGEQRSYGSDGLVTRSEWMTGVTVSASAERPVSDALGAVATAVGVPAATQERLLGSAMNHAARVGVAAGKGAEVLTRATSNVSTGFTFLGAGISVSDNLARPLLGGGRPSARQLLTLTADVGLGALGLTGLPGAIAAFGLDAGGAKQFVVNGLASEMESTQLLLEKYNDLVE